MITIYRRGTDITRVIINPDPSSEQRKRIMGEDIVSLTFQLAVYIDIQIGDHASIFGEDYYVNTLPTVKKNADRDFVCNLIMETSSYNLGKVQFLFLNADSNFTEGVFQLKGKAEDFLRLIIYNMKRVYPDIDWNAGYCVESDYKTLSFSAENCQEVLGRLASEFNTEYLVEGTTINLYKKQPASGLTLEYGAGLTSITRQNKDNSNVITRLYAYGGNKNIGSDYRGGALRLRMPGLSLYIEKNTLKYGVIEQTREFPDIFPSRTGTISSVTTPFIFADSSMDFNVNDYLMPNSVVAKLTFNTGLLAGYTFDISNYNNGTKTFTILKNTEDQTVDVPSVIMTPAIGDKYVLTDILMPAAYITAAETKLKIAAIAALNEASSPKIGYIIACDPIYFKKNQIELKLATTIVIKTDEWELNNPIRAVGYNRNIRVPSAYTTEVSDFVQETTIVKLINTI